VIGNLLDGRPDIGWGPNNRFRFPSRGGTGEIWRRVAASLPQGTIRFDCEVRAVRRADRSLLLSDGTVHPYDLLISTMPLDVLVSLTGEHPLRETASALKYSTVHVVGIGIRGAPPAQLSSKCWIYYPESAVPFYRLTVFSRYSTQNVPDPGRHWSVMVEVCESPAQPVDAGRLVDDVIHGLVRIGAIETRADIESRWHHIARHGYPTPFLGRDKVVDSLLTQLEASSIFSRGRFGAWKYEVSNQDHTFMQGVELINRLAFGSEETTLRRPDVVNARR
jgi:protoporphyrinogen oxidase